MQLTIKDWRSWGIPLNADATDQLATNEATNQPKTDKTAASPPSVNEIPPMLRRRLSPMGRAAAQCLFPLFDSLSDNLEPCSSNSLEYRQAATSSKSQTPIIFASRHGEVARTQKMLCDLAQNELLSPIAFSLSVHNAIGGIISIQQKITANITAIAADGSEIMATLIEAAGLILSGKANIADQSNQQVLCIVCDDPLPESYQAYCQMPKQAFALAFIVQGIAQKTSANQTESKNKTEQKLENKTEKHPINIQIKASQSSFIEPEYSSQAAQFTQLLQGHTQSLELSLGNSHWQIDSIC